MLLSFGGLLSFGVISSVGVSVVKSLSTGGTVLGLSVAGGLGSLGVEISSVGGKSQLTFWILFSKKLQNQFNMMDLCECPRKELQRTLFELFVLPELQGLIELFLLPVGRELLGLGVVLVLPGRELQGVGKVFVLPGRELQGVGKVLVLSGIGLEGIGGKLFVLPGIGLKEIGILFEIPGKGLHGLGELFVLQGR